MITVADWIAHLRAAGVTRVTLDLAADLPTQPLPRSFPPDTAPRPLNEPNAPAESNSAHQGDGDEPDPDQQARDLELMHSE